MILRGFLTGLVALALILSLPAARPGLLKPLIERFRRTLD